MNALIEQINIAGKMFIEFALPMLIQSSLLIIILLAINFLLRKKIRAVFRYWIWLLVLVKLVMPPSVSTPVGIGNLFGDKLTKIKISNTEITPVQQEQALGQIQIPQLTISSPKPELYKEIDPQGADIRSLEWQKEQAKIIEPATIKSNDAQIQAIHPVSISWQGALFAGWVIVVLVLILLLLQRAMFVNGLVAQAHEITGGLNDLVQSCNRLLGIKGKVKLKASPNATSPAVCGLLRPAILLPQNLIPNLSKSQIKAVLLHELVHIKRGDLWVNLFQTLLQIVYFYNPLLWLGNVIIRRIREQAVDEAVQVALAESAESYPKILVDVAKLAFRRPVLSLRLIGVVESKSTLKSRIARMLNRPIPKKAKLGIIGLLFIIVTGLILLPMAAAKVGEPTLVIKGTVTDSITGEQIAGAKVFDDGYGPSPDWQNIKAGQQSKSGAITDANGQYSFLTWPEHHSIKVQADGYTAQKKSLYSGHFTLNKKDEEIFDFSLRQNNKNDVQIETQTSAVQVEREKQIHGSGLPEGWKLEEDRPLEFSRDRSSENIRAWVSGMAYDLVKLKVIPKPVNEYDESWKKERIEFEIKNKKEEIAGNIILWNNVDNDSLILKPDKYNILYIRAKRQEKDDGCFQVLDKAEFEVDLSKAGMYKLNFRPNLSEKSEAVGQQFFTTECIGKVVDENNRAVADADVEAYEMYFDMAGGLKLRCIGKSTTGSEGKFLFNSKPTVKKSKGLGAIVVAQKKGLAIGWAHWPLYGNQDVSISLNKPEKLSGKVLDEAGKPIVNAEVRAILFKNKEEWIWLPGIEPLQWLTVKTNNKGYFEFNNIGRDLEIGLLLKADGYGTIYPINQEKDGNIGIKYASGQTGIEVKMSKEGRIKGKLLDEKTGGGIGNVTLAIVPNFTPVFFERYTCTTEENGGFEMGGLRSGQYLIRGESGKVESIDVETESGKTITDVIVKWIGKETETNTYNQTSAGQDEEQSEPTVSPTTTIDSGERRRIEGLIDQFHRTKAILAYAEHVKKASNLEQKFAEYEAKLAEILKNPPADPDEGLPKELEKAKQAYGNDWNQIYSQLRSAVGGAILAELLDTDLEPFVRFMTMYSGNITLVPVEHRDNFASSSGINPYNEPDLFWKEYKDEYLRKMFLETTSHLNQLQAKFDIPSEVVETVRSEIRKGLHMYGYRSFIDLLSEEKIQQTQKYLDTIEEKLSQYPNWKQVEQEMFKPVKVSAEFQEPAGQVGSEIKSSIQATSVPEDVQQIDKVLQQWFKACRAGDIEQAKKLLAPNSQPLEQNLQITKMILQVIADDRLIPAKVIQFEDGGITGWAAFVTENGFFFTGELSFITATLQKVKDNWLIAGIAFSKPEEFEETITSTKKQFPDADIWQSDSFSNLADKTNALLKRKAQAFEKTGWNQLEGAPQEAKDIASLVRKWIAAGLENDLETFKAAYQVNAQRNAERNLKELQRFVFAAPDWQFSPMIIRISESRAEVVSHGFVIKSQYPGYGDDPMVLIVRFIKTDGKWGILSSSNDLLRSVSHSYFQRRYPQGQIWYDESTPDWLKPDQRAKADVDIEALKSITEKVRLDYSFAEKVRAMTGDKEIFESYFPDSNEGGKALDEWWPKRGKDPEVDKKTVGMVRNGLRKDSKGKERRYRNQYITSLGSKYIWHAQEQNKEAVELLYYATYNRQLAHDAVYYGLSVARDKSDKIIKRCVELCMADASVSRILWGTEGRHNDLIQYLKPYLESSDPEIKNRAVVLEGVFKGEVDYRKWVNEQTAKRLRQGFGDKLDEIKKVLLKGNSTQRKEIFDLIRRNRLSLLFDKSFTEPLKACLTDNDPAVKEAAIENCSSLFGKGECPDEILEIMDNLSRHWDSKVKEAVAVFVGSHWIWGVTPQNPKAIEIMYRLSSDKDRSVSYDAVYYGLSVVENMDEKITKRLVDMAMDQTNDLGRIAWGLRGNADMQLLKKLLFSYLTPDSANAGRAGQLYREIFKEEPPEAEQKPTEQKEEAKVVKPDEQNITFLQNLVNSAEEGAIVSVPKGTYTVPILIDKTLTIRGEDANNCIFEVTMDGPAIIADTKGKGRVTIENLTVKWQLATSDRCDHPYAVFVKDTEAYINNCSFVPLGNYQRSPIALRAAGFTNMNVSNCRFEGYNFTVQYGEGTEGTFEDSTVLNSGHQGVTLPPGSHTIRRSEGNNYRQYYCRLEISRSALNRRRASRSEQPDYQ